MGDAFAKKDIIIYIFQKIEEDENKNKEIELVKIKIKPKSIS